MAIDDGTEGMGSRRPGSRARAPAHGPLPWLAIGLAAGLGIGLVAGWLPGRAPDMPSPSAPAATADGGAGAPGSHDPHRLSARFGVAAHPLWHDLATAVGQLDTMRDAGLGLVRFDVSWRNLEPAPGTYRHLDKLDAVLAAALARGMRAVVTVIETPAWANGGAGPWTPPDDPADYARFVALLATRHPDPAIAWEVWNEPNDAQFWATGPDPERYTQLLRATATAVRSAVPDATILGGSILYADVKFLEGMFAAGAQGSFDGLAVHPYARDAAPGAWGDGYHSFVATLDRLHDVARRAGAGDVRLWATEAGWSGERVPETARAEYLAEAVALVRDRPFVEALAVYTLSREDDARFGLTGGGETAWRAYAEAVAGSAPRRRRERGPRRDRRGRRDARARHGRRVAHGRRGRR